MPSAADSASVLVKAAFGPPTSERFAFRRSVFPAWRSSLVSLIFHLALIGAAVYAQRSVSGVQAFENVIAVELFTEPQAAPPAPVLLETEASIPAQPKANSLNQPVRPVNGPVVRPRHKSDPIKQTIAPAASVSEAGSASEEVRAPAQQTDAVAAKAEPSKDDLAALYGRIVHERIVAHRPTRAHGFGVVSVMFTLSGEGALLAVKLEQSSGNRDLDRLTLAAVRAADPFPPPPGELGNAVSYTLAFQYR